MAVPVYVPANNREYFKKLNKCVQDLVAEKVEYRAENIYRGLRFRQNLLGEHGAKWPIWKGTISSGRTDDNSFRSWKIKKNGPADFTIYNGHKNSVDGYMYVRDIFWGVSKGSNHQWAKALQPAQNLTFQGNKIFSKQLPRGLAPYFNRQDKLIREDMEKIAGEANKKRCK